MNVVQLWRAWGVGLAVIGVPILLWGGAGPPDHDPRDMADLIKDVPAIPTAAVDPADVAELDTGVIWGAEATNTAQSGTAPASAGIPEWTLGGVFMKDDRRHIVVNFANGDTPPVLLREGDALPDGARILRIARDKVRVGQPGKAADTRWLTVNRGAPPGPPTED